jgi:hypothetical protein
MPEEETKEEGLTIEEEEVDITIGTTMMRIERQEIGDRVHLSLHTSQTYLMT